MCFFASNYYAQICSDDQLPIAPPQAREGHHLDRAAGPEEGGKIGMETLG